jgi:hypothetical protein
MPQGLRNNKKEECMNETVSRPDIWDAGIKNHCAKAKLSLLCYIDEIIPQTKDPSEKERLGRVKARIHNEISELSLNIRILFSCFKAGADISPLGDEMSRKGSDNNTVNVNKVKQFFKDENKLSNAVIK